MRVGSDSEVMAVIQDPDAPCQRRLAVGAVLLDPQGRVLLVYNRRSGGGGHWSLPKGSCQTGETLVETLCREVREETGLRVEPIELAFVTEFYVPAKGEWFLQHYFHARVVAGEAAVQPQEPEVSKVKWVPVAHLPGFLTFRPWLVPLQIWLRERRARYHLFPAGRGEG
ncbi:MAG: NUDIX hydrolase [Firmicutes bacterium]|nr:NUDIX hydrolase [Bacillota bacterium]